MKQSRVSFPNDYGYGKFTVRVTTKKTYGNYRNQEMKWLGVVEGNNIHIYDYDCLAEDELTNENNILYTLPEGRWAVYALDGNILLERWD